MLMFIYAEFTLVDREKWPKARPKASLSFSRRRLSLDVLNLLAHLFD
mgnify:CR=1 FL=1